MRKATLAGLVALGATLGTSSAEASDYGCQVLLCLANPAGPMAVSACVPPISQLWRDLARTPPRPFPTCDEARPAVAIRNTSWYDPCPEGTVALEAGAYATLASDLYALSPVIGIGTGDDLAPTIDSGPLSSRKVCVSGPRSQVSTWLGSVDGGSMVMVTTYDRMVVMDPASSPRVIDVYVDGSLYRRVRW